MPGNSEFHCQDPKKLIEVLNHEQNKINIEFMPIFSRQYVSGNDN